MGEDEGAGKRSSLAGTMASINSWLTSSHKTRWLLGDQELEKRRAACYEKSLGEIERYKPESASTSAADNPVAVSLEEQKQLLSSEEERRLRGLRNAQLHSLLLCMSLGSARPRA